MIDERLLSQTRNKYLTAAVTFGNWMVCQKRAKLNSFASIDRFGTPGDEYRRAFDPDEAVRIVAAEEAGEAIEGQPRKSAVRWRRTDVQRALLYRFAWETGLRHGTI